MSRLATTIDEVAAGHGLDDVEAASTRLSAVDGDAGRLVIRGAALDALAGHARFEDVLRRLWAGYLEPLPDAATIGPRLGRARERVFEVLQPALNAVAALPVLEAMRVLLCLLDTGTSDACPRADDDVDAALDLAAAPAVALAAVLRQRAAQPPLAPDASRGHAADLLRMAGLPHDASRAAALDAYLVTVCDHGLNASTFAARVVASTQAGLCSAVVAGLSALKGPLHGGAPGPVLDMLDAIGTPAHAEPWLEAALARGERLMGFGHRIYRVRDPRADALQGALQRLLAAGSAPGRAADGSRLALACAVEAAALALLARLRPGRPLQVNVEFYTALLLDALGLPREAFTGVFACGRVLGWVAHAREHERTGRLVRPRSRYVGPAPGADTPLEYSSHPATADTASCQNPRQPGPPGSSATNAPTAPIPVLNDTPSARPAVAGCSNASSS